MRWLITGSAGFIGFHLAKRVLELGHDVLGIDGMTPYYDVKLKEDRHAQLSPFDKFRARRMMLDDVEALGTTAESFAPDLVVHLAAQAGVRYSQEQPRSYITSNIVGTFNVLEVCRHVMPRHLMLASTSSVYGCGDTFPFEETNKADHPLTPYAASKKSVEAIAHSYAHLWKLPTTVFRFFSAYGAWGRPDMALFKFVRDISVGVPIDVYNRGEIERDFTYIDDLVEAAVRLSAVPPNSDRVEHDSLSPVAPYRIVNIGGHRPVSLLTFIEEIERALGRKAVRNLMPLQVGDVVRTEASTDLLEALTGYRPETPISVGIPKFIGWFRDYYRM
jgi:UDP-glucuronate 4-epimerase